MRSYREGKVLDKTEMYPDWKERYGAPFFECRPCDFHSVLFDEAKRLGVEFRLGSKIESINFSKTSIQTRDGDEFHADFIVGADGMGSICRELLLGRPDPPRLTGIMAYRIQIDLKDMMQHPELVEFVSEHNLTEWFGPHAHAVGGRKVLTMSS